MQDTQNDGPVREIITIYGPIFKEKLEKLERCGQGSCAEAVGLRKTLALIDKARSGTRPDEADQSLSVGAE